MTTHLSIVVGSVGEGAVDCNAQWPALPMQGALDAGLLLPLGGGTRLRGGGGGTLRDAGLLLPLGGGTRLLCRAPCMLLRIPLSIWKGR